MAVWGAAIAFWGKSLIDYACTSEPTKAARPQWPANEILPAPADEAVLVMFLHPRCPCSRASIGNLDRLLAQARGSLRAHVLFVHPGQAGSEWKSGRMWNAAKSIPGVDVRSDPEGALARIFGATISGEVFLHGRDGGLVFHCGITPVRGHEGDSNGLDAILAHLRGKTVQWSVAETFGCRLLDSEGNSDPVTGEAPQAVLGAN